RKRSTASRPLAASATRRRSGCSAMSAAIPSRSRGWSSATRMRIGSALVGIVVDDTIHYHLPPMRYSLCLLLVAATGAFATTDISAYRSAHQDAILGEFVELLKIPNVASDRTNIQRNADAIVTLMRARGLSPRLLTPRSAPDSPPLLYGEW